MSDGMFLAATVGVVVALVVLERRTRQASDDRPRWHTRRRN